MSQPETTEQAAAAVTAAMLGEFLKDGDENAARMLAEMAGSDEAPETVSSPASQADPLQLLDRIIRPDQQAEAEAAVETTVPASLPDFAPQLTDDLQALLEEPDFDEEAAAEIDAEFDDSVEFDGRDPEMEKRIRALEKRNAWLEGRAVDASKGKWVAENEKAYPLLKTYAPDELRGINATSRRAFAREAAALNARYEKVLAPALADLAAAKALAQGDAEAAARKKAAQNWGLPAVEAAGGAVTANEQQEHALAEARARRAPLEERIKILAGIEPKQ